MYLLEILRLGIPKYYVHIWAKFYVLWIWTLNAVVALAL